MIATLSGWSAHAPRSLRKASKEEFGIEIPDDAAENIQSFGDAVKFINDNS